jgi:hypothetical protein
MDWISSPGVRWAIATVLVIAGIGIVPVSFRWFWDDPDSVRMSPRNGRLFTAFTVSWGSVAVLAAASLVSSGGVRDKALVLLGLGVLTWPFLIFSMMKAKRSQNPRA